MLIPWGEERYDLAIDEGGRLVRIQCKTGHIRDGCVCFKTSITDARRPLGDGGYAGQIEAFAVYCPQIDRTYLVPIEVVKTTIGARLRLEPARNGQTWNQVGSRFRARLLAGKTKGAAGSKIVRYRCATSAGVLR